MGNHRPDIKRKPLRGHWLNPDRVVQLRILYALGPEEAIREFVPARDNRKREREEQNN